MGKRSDFPRRAQDAYDTPLEAVVPLSKHLPQWFSYWEPCAGKGSLIDAISHLRCVSFCSASDIAPRCDVPRINALMPIPKKFRWITAVDYIITNPPWTRQILHPMIEHFSAMRPTWLLFDADWMHTKQAEPYLRLCHKIVSVGRVKWIPDSPHTGKDNCAWYLFDARKVRATQGPVFFGRSA